MSEARSALMFAAVLFLILLGTLSSYADYAADEHLYLAGAQVMKEGGSLLVPAYHTGQPRYMKPPLFYWLAWLSMLVFGTGFFAARLPALLSGMAALYFTYRLASDGGRRARDGAMATAALGGSYLFLYHARASVTDMTMTAGIVAGLWCFQEYALARRGIACLYLSAAALGLACMAKGPVALVLAGASAALYLVLPGRPPMPGLRPSVHWLGALLLLSAVGFWWYAAMWATEGPAFMSHQVDAEVAARTRASIAGRFANLAWYAGRMITSGLPWTLVILVGMASARPQASPSRRLAWCACLATVVFYGLAISWRASRYLVPITPFVAILASGYLGQGSLSGKDGGRSGQVLKWSTVFLAAVSAPILLFVLAAARGGLATGQKAAVAIAALCAAGLGLYAARGRMTALRKVQVCSCVLAFLLIVPVLLVKGIFRADPILALAEATHGFPQGEAVSDKGLTNRQSALLFVFGKRDAVRLGKAPLASDFVILQGGEPPESFEVREVFEGPVSRGVPPELSEDIAGILARGDLLQNLPRTRYTLARPRAR